MLYACLLLMYKLSKSTVHCPSLYACMQSVYADHTSVERFYTVVQIIQTIDCMNVEPCTCTSVRISFEWKNWRIAITVVYSHALLASRVCIYKMS